MKFEKPLRPGARPVLGVLLAIVLIATVSVAQAATINEIRISSPGGSDNTSNFFELAGTPGESLDGLSFVVISTQFDSGLINSAVSLDGLSIPSDGFFLGATELTEYGASTDLATGVDFFGSPTTFLLVRDFTSVANADLDVTNDGVLDSVPWNEIVDIVSIANLDPVADFGLGGQVVAISPPSLFAPSHIERLPDGMGMFVTSGDRFNDRSGDTPGSRNAPVPEPVSSGLAMLAATVVAIARQRRSAS